MRGYQRGSERRPKLPPPPPLRLPPKPPRSPPKPRPPPPPPRFSRGLASLTLSARPPTSLPLNCSIAAFASSSVDISTKAKPLERPVSRSSITLADETVPAWANNVWRSWLVVWKARFPTYSFVDIYRYTFPLAGNEKKLRIGYASAKR